VDSRERVLASLNHKEPDRVPIDFAGTGVSTICYQAYDNLRDYLDMPPKPFDPNDLGGATWAGVVKPHEDMYQRLRSDVEMVGMRDPQSWNLKIEFGEKYDTYIDEWGTRLYRPKGGHYFDYTDFPIKEGTVESFRKWKNFPDPRDPGRWKGFREECLQVRERGRALTSFSVFGGGIFEQPARIMPMEEFLIGIGGDPKFSDLVLGTMYDIYYDATQKMLEEVGDILDVWVYWDDLSGQNGPLVSPRWYEKHLMPLHRKLFDKVQSMTDAKIFFHTCGSVKTWIPYLIDVGVDILNPVQISAEDMDPFELKKEFGKDIVFWGGACNPQDTLAFGTPEQVADEVSRNIDALAPGGGFILANVHNIQNLVPPENIVAMFDTAYEYGSSL
jgi:uroporphyrinogen decarboxylase